MYSFLLLQVACAAVSEFESLSEVSVARASPNGKFRRAGDIAAQMAKLQAEMEAAAALEQQPATKADVLEIQQTNEDSKKDLKDINANLKVEIDYLTFKVKEQEKRIEAQEKRIEEQEKIKEMLEMQEKRIKEQEKMKEMLKIQEKRIEEQEKMKEMLELQRKRFELQEENMMHIVKSLRQYFPILTEKEKEGRSSNFQRKNNDIYIELPFLQPPSREMIHNAEDPFFSIMWNSKKQPGDQEGLQDPAATKFEKCEFGIKITFKHPHWKNDLTYWCENAAITWGTANFSDIKPLDFFPQARRSRLFALKY